MSLPLPPKPLPMPRPLPPPAATKMIKLGYNCAQLYIAGNFTRAELFRLIGELERMGSEL